MNKEIVISNQGKSDYSIVLPKTVDEIIDFVSKDLQFLIKEATGCLLNILDKNVSKNSIALIISSDEKEYTELEKINSQGYVIKVEDDNIKIIAKTTIGVSNGVYGFLTEYLNFDCFYTDNYYIDKVDTLKIGTKTVISSPDIEYRVASYGYQRNFVATKSRMRLMRYEDIFADTSMGQFHNIYAFISPEEYYDEHSEWFEKDKKQLCYTAHGDEKSLALMIETVATKTFQYLQKSNSSEIVFALNDNEARCDCDACNKEKEKYGVDSGAFIKFINRVAVLVENKLKEAGDKRADTFHIVFYAYFYLEDAPVKIKKYPNGKLFHDGTGKVVFFFEPEMVLNRHVSPMICQFWIDYHQSYYAKDNEKYLEIIKKWCAISENIHLWTYDQFFCNGGYMLPYNSFDYVADMYRMAKYHNIMWVYPEGQAFNNNSTGFVAYRGYLQSKISWDVQVDENELKEKFFKNMYGVAYQDMIDLYDSIHKHLTHLNKDFGITGWCHNHTLYELAYWPYNVVKKWLDSIFNIEEKLIKANDFICAKNVRLEAISILYIFLRIYKKSLNEEKKNEYIALLKAYIKEFDISMRCQEMKMDVYLDKINTEEDV